MSLYLDPAAFATPVNTVRGNSGVGIVPGPGMFLWDTSLRKQFALTERVNLGFQADMFNLLNHANSRGFDTVVGDRAFGSITAAGPARNIQFGLRLQF